MQKRKRMDMDADANVRKVAKGKDEGAAGGAEMAAEPVLVCVLLRTWMIVYVDELAWAIVFLPSRTQSCNLLRVCVHACTLVQNKYAETRRTRAHTPAQSHNHTHAHTWHQVALSEEETAALQAAKQVIKGLCASLAHKNQELDKLAAGLSAHARKPHA